MSTPSNGNRPMEPGAYPPDVEQLLSAERAEHLEYVRHFSPPPEAVASVLAQVLREAGHASVTAGTTAALGAVGATKLAAVIVSAFAVGVGSGVAGTLVVTQRQPVVVQALAVEQPVEEPPPPVKPVEMADPAPPSPPPRSVDSKPKPVPARKSVAPAEPVAPVRDPTAERALVDMARTALARKRPQDALDALAEHTRRFPEGLLAEERDALHALALWANGQQDQARAAAKRFFTRYPDSLFAEPVRATLDAR